MIFGWAVRAARWRGVWATSFWMFSRHGCGAMRIRAATTSTDPEIQARCRGLKQETEQKIQHEFVGLFTCRSAPAHSSLPVHLSSAMWRRKNPSKLSWGKVMWRKKRCPEKPVPVPAHIPGKPRSLTKTHVSVAFLASDNGLWVIHETLPLARLVVSAISWCLCYFGKFWDSHRKYSTYRFKETWFNNDSKVVPIIYNRIHHVNFPKIKFIL